MSLLQCSNCSETHLIRVQTPGNSDTFLDMNLKIINKQVFHIKERKVNMALIKKLVSLDHPSIQCLKYFYMS